jgi:hypothetical protein
MSDDDPLDPTEFRFRNSNTHNRDMLELHAEKAFAAGDPAVAAMFAQAAALYAIVGAISHAGWRLTDDLKSTQKAMVELRRERSPKGEVPNAH